MEQIDEEALKKNKDAQGSRHWVGLGHAGVVQHWCCSFKESTEEWMLENVGVVVQRCGTHMVMNMDAWATSIMYSTICIADHLVRFLGCWRAAHYP